MLRGTCSALIPGMEALQSLLPFFLGPDEILQVLVPLKSQLLFGLGRFPLRAATTCNFLHLLIMLPLNFLNVVFGALLYFTLLLSHLSLDSSILLSLPLHHERLGMQYFVDVVFIISHLPLTV